VSDIVRLLTATGTPAKYKERERKRREVRKGSQLGMTREETAGVLWWKTTEK
jgi:hypothetical protein